MFSTFLRTAFSTKSYTSSFKIRSRLSEFFKHVHPDQLNQAPPKIKDENLRSLTNFNSYIDAINQGKPIEGKLLKFYLSEKTNLKSKKFFSFSIQLPQIPVSQADLPEEKAKKLVDNIVEVLNRKFMESKSGGKQNKDKDTIANPEVESLADKESSDDRFIRMASNIQPFDRKSRYNSEEANRLQSSLNAKYMEAEKNSLENKLQKSVSFADTRSNKSMMWSRLAAEESGIYKDFQDILDELIDPRLIYFDENLTMEQIETFKKKILPGGIDREAINSSRLLTSVCSKMQSYEPPLCFYVSDHYSATDIPGFFTVPFNFHAKELSHNFDKFANTIVEERDKYQQYYDYYQDIREQLSDENNLHIQETNFKNNDQIWRRILALKRLKRYRPQEKTQVVIFSSEQFGIFKSQYQPHASSVLFFEGKLILSVDFSDDDMAAQLDRRQY